MTTRPAVVLPVLAALVAALLTGLLGAAPTTSAAGPDARAATLSITPDHDYVGGQALRFAGTLGGSGVRRIGLQYNMNRPGDAWTAIDDLTASTDASGGFSFTYPARSMFGISLRVVGGGTATPAVTLSALSSDLVLHLRGQRGAARQVAVVDRPFDVVVDTTPRLARRPDTVGLQPIPGRGLTLQRRIDGDEWETLATTKVGRTGLGTFRDVVETATGDVVYRVRQEDWTRDGNEIGWFPSFPTYVAVRQARAAERLRDAPAPSTRAGSRAVDAPAADVDAATGGSTTASQVFGWAPAVFDFTWEQGESLTSPPGRGTDRTGHWVDYSDGGGRVAKHNGGLMLDSKRDNAPGPGDFGTTMATLQGNPLTWGRFETRVRVRSDETRDRDYRVLVQLVPARAPNDACRTITLADYEPHGSTVRFGASNGGSTWTGSTRVGRILDASIAFAAEVARDHVTFFLEGRPIGSVSGEDVAPGVPMTMRLAMVGAGAAGAQREMDHSSVISDWQRGFTLERGRQVRRGGSLEQGTAPGC